MAVAEERPVIVTSTQQSVKDGDQIYHQLAIESEHHSQQWAISPNISTALGSSTTPPPPFTAAKVMIWIMLLERSFR